MNKLFLRKTSIVVTLLALISSTGINAAEAAGGGGGPEIAEKVIFDTELGVLIRDDGARVEITLADKPSEIEKIIFKKESLHFAALKHSFIDWLGDVGIDHKGTALYRRLDGYEFFLERLWEARVDSPIAPLYFNVDIIPKPFDFKHCETRYSNPWAFRNLNSDKDFSFYNKRNDTVYAYLNTFPSSVSASLTPPTISTIGDLDILTAYLESKGVSRELFFRWFPRYPGTDDPAYVIPEAEMVTHLEKIVAHFTFDPKLSVKESLELLLSHIREFQGEQTGPVLLGVQLDRAQFPLDYFISKALTEKQKDLSGESRIRYLDTALLAYSRIASEDKFRTCAEDIKTNSPRYLSTLLQARLKMFLDTFNSAASARDLEEHFFALVPQAIQGWIKTTNFPTYFFMGEHFLNYGEKALKELAAECFALVAEGASEPNSLMDYWKEAQGKLVQIRSLFIHEQFACAGDQSAKCRVVRDYLDAICRSDRAVFPQELVNAHVSQLALGPWGELVDDAKQLPFSIDCASDITAFHFCKHLAGQQKAICEAQAHSGEKVPSHFALPVDLRAPLTKKLAQMVVLSAEAQQELHRCREQKQRKDAELNKGGDQ